jgi:hypothetical protein
MRPAEVRFYVDADILGLAKVLVAVRGDDFTFPGDVGGIFHKRERPACPIAKTSTPDTVWLPEAAKRGWLIISRDHNIAENLAELEAVKASGARMVALAGDDAANTWGQLEVFMRRWRQIEALLDEGGPFIYLASRTVWRRLDLDGPRVRTRSSKPRAPGPHGSQADPGLAGLWPEPK